MIKNRGSPHVFTPRSEVVHVAQALSAEHSTFGAFALEIPDRTWSGAGFAA